MADPTRKKNRKKTSNIFFQFHDFFRINLSYQGQIIFASPARKKNRQIYFLFHDFFFRSAAVGSLNQKKLTISMVTKSGLYCTRIKAAWMRSCRKSLHANLLHPVFRMSICRKKKRHNKWSQNCLLQEILNLSIIGSFHCCNWLRIIHDRNENLAGEKVEAGVNAATQKGQKADVTKGSPTSIFRVA